MSDTRVTDDPSAPLPIGCIDSRALRMLAEALDRFEMWHHTYGGRNEDRPCLRRIESEGKRVIAHVSTGPAVGGTWERFTVGPNGWELVTKDR